MHACVCVVCVCVGVRVCIHLGTLLLPISTQDFTLLHYHPMHTDATLSRQKITKCVGVSSVGTMCLDGKGLRKVPILEGGTGGT